MALGHSGPNKVNISGLFVSLGGENAEIPNQLHIRTVSSCYSLIVWQRRTKMYFIKCTSSYMQVSTNVVHVHLFSVDDALSYVVCQDFADEQRWSFVIHIIGMGENRYQQLAENVRWKTVTNTGRRMTFWCTLLTGAQEAKWSVQKSKLNFEWPVKIMLSSTGQLVKCTNCIFE